MTVKDELFLGGAVLAAAGGVLLVIGWLIGVQGHLKLITNYRAHPERYPDGPGLGRWMGWTLALGGTSFLLCGAALMTGAIGEPAVGPWVLASAAGLLAGAFSGLARYRRMPPPTPPAGTGPRRR
jgi:hypothetical protein